MRREKSCYESIIGCKGKKVGIRLDGHDDPVCIDKVTYFGLYSIFHADT